MSNPKAIGALAFVAGIALAGTAYAEDALTVQQRFDRIEQRLDKIGEFQRTVVAPMHQDILDGIKRLEMTRQPRSRAVLREFQRQHPCPSTHKTTGACPGWVKDHIVSLHCGGPDAVANLQWQTDADAKAKDRWENQCAKESHK